MSPKKFRGEWFTRKTTGWSKRFVSSERVSTYLLILFLLYAARHLLGLYLIALGARGRREGGGEREEGGGRRVKEDREGIRVNEVWKKRRVKQDKKEERVKEVRDPGGGVKQVRGLEGVRVKEY